MRARSLFRHLGIPVGAILLVVFFVEFFDWREASKHIAEASWRSVMAAAGCFVAGTFLRAFKWGYILRLWERPSWRQCIDTMLVSNFANYFFPVRVGELFRLYVINRVALVSYSSSMAATVVDRASSLIVIAMVLVWLPFAGFRVVGGSGNALWLSIVAALLAVALLFGPVFVGKTKGLVGASMKQFRFSEAAIQHMFSSRLAKFFFRTLSQCNMFSLRGVALIKIFALSVGILCLDALANYFLLGAFGLQLTPLQALISAGLLNIAFVLPSPPGQVGNAEVIPLAIFSYGFGLSSGLISSAAVLWHLIAMGITTLLGVYAAYALGINLHDAYSRFKNKHEMEAP